MTDMVDTNVTILGIILECNGVNTPIKILSDYFPCNMLSSRITTFHYIKYYKQSSHVLRYMRRCT